MNIPPIASRLGDWLAILSVQWHLARRRRSSLEELASMPEYELGDIGLSYAVDVLQAARRQAAQA